MRIFFALVRCRRPGTRTNRFRPKAMNTLKTSPSAWAAALVVVTCSHVLLHAQESQSVKRILTERRAAYDKCVVLTDEKVPNCCVLTYFQHGTHYTDVNYLVKILPTLEIDGNTFMPTQAQNISVEDFPGGVVAKFKLHGIRVETKIRPLMIGRETNSWVGAALYEIETKPRVPVIVKIGCGQSPCI